MNTAIFTLGLPGSGKTSFINDLVKSQMTQTALISADKIRVQHPLYDPKFPDKLHEECVHTAEKLVYKAANQGLDIIMDGGGINDNYTARIIKYLKEEGYYIKVYFLNTPVSTCIERNKQRIENNERFVPISAIIEKSYKLQDSITRLQALAHEFYEIKYFTNEHVFVDMDGVIAEYQELPINEDGDVNFVSHDVFLNARPVYEVIDKLFQVCNDIYILSASPNSICNDQKIQWLKKHMSFVPEDKIFFVGNKDFKHLMLNDLILKLGFEKKDCTLIDDDHFILEKVNKLGIRAIHPSKFLANF
jgi:predicted ABC-type ATPase